MCAHSVLSDSLCHPMDCSSPGSSDHEILQTRLLEWVAVSSSRESSQPRDWSCIFWVPCIGGWILYRWATWEGHLDWLSQKNFSEFSAFKLHVNRRKDQPWKGLESNVPDWKNNNSKKCELQRHMLLKEKMSMRSCTDVSAVQTGAFCLVHWWSPVYHMEPGVQWVCADWVNEKTKGSGSKWM